MKKYGLIGYPLAHSLSAEFFNAKFKTEGINAVYELFPLESLSQLKSLLSLHPSLQGFNVTSPYKVEVMRYLDRIDEEAELTGAVNTIRVERARFRRPHLVGYNTDVKGFADSLELIRKPWHTRALVLGSGGAALAVMRALKKMGIVHRQVSRTPSAPGVYAYSDLTPEIIERHKLIVNATPVGMYPHIDQCPSIPFEGIGAEHLCYDLIYNPQETIFMHRAQAQGASVQNGLEMLLIQALCSWRIWNER